MSEEKLILTANDGLGNYPNFAVSQADIDEAMNEGKATDGFLPGHTDIMSLIIDKYCRKKRMEDIIRVITKEADNRSDPEYETYQRLHNKFYNKPKPFDEIRREVIEELKIKREEEK